MSLRDTITPIIHIKFILLMKDYTYQLQKYSGRNSRHTCPACGRPHCFTYYVDANNQPIAEDVGRCEHLSKCGYHKTPAQHFTEHPQERKEYRPALHQYQKGKIQTDYIPFSLIQRSESMDNNLMRYLEKFFPIEELEKVTHDYHLGSTKKGEIIFPQIDRAGMCRTGKVMDYGNDGHRIKRINGDAIDWLHSRYKRAQSMKDYNMTQCLFGEHLLTTRPHDIVCLTEGEKTAVICAMVFPQFVWVSCGGKGMFSAERCKALTGCNVIVYADAEATEEWREKMKNINYCRSIRLSDWAKEEAPGSKRDIADLIMEQRKPLEKPTTIGDVCQWMQELGIPKGRITINV